MGRYLPCPCTGLSVCVWASLQAMVWLWPAPAAQAPAPGLCWCRRQWGAWLCSGVFHLEDLPREAIAKPLPYSYLARLCDRGQSRAVDTDLRARLGRAILNRIAWHAAATTHTMPCRQGWHLAFVNLGKRGAIAWRSVDRSTDCGY